MRRRLYPTLNGLLRCPFKHPGRVKNGGMACTIYDRADSTTSIMASNLAGLVPSTNYPRLNVDTNGTRCSVQASIHAVAPPLRANSVLTPLHAGKTKAFHDQREWLDTATDTEKMLRELEAEVTELLLSKTLKLELKKAAVSLNTPIAELHAQFSLLIYLMQTPVTSQDDLWLAQMEAAVAQAKLLQKSLHEIKSGRIPMVLSGLLTRSMHTDDLANSIQLLLTALSTAGGKSSIPTSTERVNKVTEMLTDQILARLITGIAIAYATYFVTRLKNQLYGKSHDVLKEDEVQASYKSFEDALLASP